jgi:hypothetical protein
LLALMTNAAKAVCFKFSNPLAEANGNDMGKK